VISMFTEPSLSGVTDKGNTRQSSNFGSTSIQLFIASIPPVILQAVFPSIGCVFKRAVNQFKYFLFYKLTFSMLSGSLSLRHDALGLRME